MSSFHGYTIFTSSSEESCCEHGQWKYDHHITLFLPTGLVNVRGLTWYLEGAPVAVATAICAYWLIGLLYPTADRGLLLNWAGVLGKGHGKGWVKIPWDSMYRSRLNPLKTHASHAVSWSVPTRIFNNAVLSRYLPLIWTSFSTKKTKEADLPALFCIK